MPIGNENSISLPLPCSAIERSKRTRILTDGLGGMASCRRVTAIDDELSQLDRGQQSVVHGCFQTLEPGGCWILYMLINEANF